MLSALLKPFPRIHAAAFPDDPPLPAWWVAFDRFQADHAGKKIRFYQEEMRTSSRADWMEHVWLPYVLLARYKELSDDPKRDEFLPVYRYVEKHGIHKHPAVNNHWWLCNRLREAGGGGSLFEGGHMWSWYWIQRWKLIQYYSNTLNNPDLCQRVKPVAVFSYQLYHHTRTHFPELAPQLSLICHANGRFHEMFQSS